VNALAPSRADGYLTTKEAALLVGVSPSTIAAWRNAGLLPSLPSGRGRERVHDLEAVRAAERKVRENGLARGGYDPRRLRSAASRTARQSPGLRPLSSSSEAA
jgi:hypothetical protein